MKITELDVVDTKQLRHEDWKLDISNLTGLTIHST